MTASNDPLNPPSRRQSITSQSSSADFGRLLPGSSQVNDAPNTAVETSAIASELQQDAATNVTQQSNTTSRYHLSTLSPQPCFHEHDAIPL